MRFVLFRKIKKPYRLFNLYLNFVLNAIFLGASKNSIDLLPSPGVGTEWTKSLPTDEGRESDEIFEFDGANTAVAIPNDVLDHNLSSVFTVSAWLKHKHIPTQEKHVKEHVICSADDHSK